MCERVCFVLCRLDVSISVGVSSICTQMAAARVQKFSFSLAEPLDVAGTNVYTIHIIILLLMRTQAHFHIHTHYQRQIVYLHTFTHTLQTTATRTRTTIVPNNCNNKKQLHATRMQHDLQVTTCRKTIWHHTAKYCPNRNNCWQRRWLVVNS